uniref:Peptidyl-prolyl cis-trans isomerase n=1 Tax=Trypanosoma congolense (strain IL3000) TaxID=1068625 RepID=G0URH8_TRYCI|nr:putative cyclophilin type peptidyl-prolyl cis-trans isomerase [Trypanosoma congolense IL3000]
MKLIDNGVSVVELYTNEGVVSIELYELEAPCAAKSFLQLAESGQLNGARFERMVPGFLLECRVEGDMAYGELTEAEEGKTLRHTGAGIVSCYGSVVEKGRFFITLAPQPKLDGVCTIFGRVYSGMSIVRKISQSRVMEENFRLYTPVVIQRCTVRVLPREDRPGSFVKGKGTTSPRDGPCCEVKGNLLNDLE